MMDNQILIILLIIFAIVAIGLTFFDSSRQFFLIDQKVTNTSVTNEGIGFASTDFIDANLSASVFTFDHNLNVNYALIEVYDNNDMIIIPDDITNLDVNSVTIDLSSFTPLTGTWNASASGGAFDANSLSGQFVTSSVFNASFDDDFNVNNKDRLLQNSVYSAGASLTLEADTNKFNVNDTNLFAVLDFTKSTVFNAAFDSDFNSNNSTRLLQDSNCDSNSSCVITGDVSGATGLPSGALGTFQGVTSTTQDGNLSFDGNFGYVAANNMCDGNFTGTHWCTTDEIKATIDDNNHTSFTTDLTSWIMEGAPGFLANANDCSGMTDNTSTFLGAFWEFNSNTGGEAFLTNCSVKKQLACCGG